MKFHNCIAFNLFFVLGVSSLQNANAFTFNSRSTHQQSSLLPRSMASSDNNASAKAFTDYMAKSHEEKLKALKDLEDKKNNEIKALKDELENAKSGESANIVASTPQSPPPAAPVVEGSVEDLSAKLLAYQKFMSEYIVKAQLEKYEAVKAAEASIAKKYEDKLNAFMLPGAEEVGSLAVKAEDKTLFEQRSANVAAAAKAGKSRWGSKEVEKAAGSTVEKPAPAVSAEAVKEESTLYASRNANLAAAAKAGKSRWGSQEIEKVSGIVVEKTTAPTSGVNPPPDASPEAIAAADHGLRADGGVGGLTLAERVSAGLAAGGDTSAITAASSLYAKRNARVAEAANAGKSRWGSKEVEKVLGIVSNTPVIVSSPEVEAADHGLRADGGVGGPSLAERVNLGAQLLQ